MFELSLFRPEEIERYGPAAGLFREAVSGTVYQNAVARLVHGPEGLVCELEKPWSALFVWLGGFAAEVVGRRQAHRALWEAFADAEREGSLLVVYDERRSYWRRPGRSPLGEARLAAPYCFVLETPRVRRLLFFTGREFLDFKKRPGFPVLAPLRE